MLKQVLLTDNPFLYCRANSETARAIGLYSARVNTNRHNMIQYPHFILDKPLGNDCFDGHSQKKLAHNICNYVRMTDTKPEKKANADKQTMNTMPRIIGLEGDWGSGKSNVVRMIDDELSKEGYYTFTYDAWGHQEDLQRRSILETLIGKLIDDDVLKGIVKIPMRNGKLNEAIWRDQLSLLLSNKTTTIRKSTPKLTLAAICGVGIVALFAICSLVASQLITEVAEFKCYWWIDFIPIAFALIVALFFFCKDHSGANLLRMVDYTKNDTVDEEYTSSEEPSVAEFKNWMRTISDYLGNNSKCKYNKLVIVFDNMDRLPSDKVMQLWSSIYTFFAGGDFENVWAIIPYDYKHLCQAIYGSEESCTIEDRDSERIKQFISKTFPIIYHVPQPVITDYRKLFNTYFVEAFGPDVHDKEHICQVFMHLNSLPNPRTVIRFVNELVAMRLQWSDEKYRLQNQALYILKKDYLFYMGDNLETRLLSDELFDKIAPFYPDRDKVRTELCQYAYGLEDEQLASELPLRNELERLIKEGKPVKDYVSRSDFLTVLEKVIAAIDQVTLNNAVVSLVSLDGVEFTSDSKERIQKKWDFLANLKSMSSFDSHQYDDIITILINHATPVRINQMARAFATAMQRIKVTDGARYYQSQNKLQLALKNAKVSFDDSDWYKLKSCEPEQFVQYVCEAKKRYPHYQLTTDVKSLNEYLLRGAISGVSQVATVVDYIKNDINYDLSELKNSLASVITQDRIKGDISVAAYINRVLSNDADILKVRFKKDTVTSFLNGNQASWAEKQPVGLEDVMAMSLADGNDINEIDDGMIPRICGCMERYLTYDDVLKNMGVDGSAFRKLNVYCIEQQEGRSLDLNYASSHLLEIQRTFGVDVAIILKQFNRWPTINWGDLDSENRFVKDVKSYVHQPFFRAYRDNPGNFSDSIINLGIKALSLQKKGFLVRQKKVQSYNRIVIDLIIDEYWKSFVETYLGSNYMRKAGELLTSEAVIMLQWLYDYDKKKDPTLLNAILKVPDEAILKNYLHKMMNENFAKADITKEKFMCFGNLLPMLGAGMDSNTARGLMNHFIKPICKDVDCAAIIVANKAFYSAIMRLDTVVATPIAKEMIEMDAYQTIADVIISLLPKEEN